MTTTEQVVIDLTNEENTTSNTDEESQKPKEEQQQQQKESIENPFKTQVIEGAYEHRMQVLKGYLKKITENNEKIKDYEEKIQELREESENKVKFYREEVEFMNSFNDKTEWFEAETDRMKNVLMPELVKIIKKCYETKVKLYDFQEIYVPRNEEEQAIMTMDFLFEHVPIIVREMNNQYQLQYKTVKREVALCKHCPEGHHQCVLTERGIFMEAESVVLNTIEEEEKHPEGDAASDKENMTEDGSDDEEEKVDDGQDDATCVEVRASPPFALEEEEEVESL